MAITPTSSFRLDSETLAQLERLDVLIRERQRRSDATAGGSLRALTLRPNRTEALALAVFHTLSDLEAELDIPPRERLGLEAVEDGDDAL